MVTISVTVPLANLAHEGRLREVDLKAGASAVRAGGVTTRTRADPGSAFLCVSRRCLAVDIKEYLESFKWIEMVRLFRCCLLSATYVRLR
jgi:hypothetical protein